jgi:hypothetical protein
MMGGRCEQAERLLGVAAMTNKVWVSLCAVWVGMFLPLASSACDSTNRQQCRERLEELVTYRAEAIERAFGDLVRVLPDKVSIKFVGPRDSEYDRYSRRIAYDAAHGTLVVPRSYIMARIPNPIRATAYYWPFYENELYRQTFPVIAAVDNALWGAYLQEAAEQRGLSWPHANCASVNAEKRLPCEMLVEGVAEHLTAIRNPLFNSNRLDQIWPQNFSKFEDSVSGRDDPRYRDVQRYGGLMLIKPLIDEFGVPHVLFYIAQTPFTLQDNDLRASALGYQVVARESLEAAKKKIEQAAGAVSVNPDAKSNTFATVFSRIEDITRSASH